MRFNEIISVNMTSEGTASTEVYEGKIRVWSF